MTRIRADVPVELDRNLSEPIRVIRGSILLFRNRLVQSFRRDVLEGVGGRALEGGAGPGGVDLCEAG